MNPYLLKSCLPEGAFKHTVPRERKHAWFCGQLTSCLAGEDPYHFVNFPKHDNAYDQQSDCKLRNGVIEAITWYVQVLKSPDAPRNEKRTALRFVAHLVGDIHQPLHFSWPEARRRRRIPSRSKMSFSACRKFHKNELLQNNRQIYN
jgi:hypothetical protein